MTRRRSTLQFLASFGEPIEGMPPILRAELAFDEPLTGVLASDDICWPQRPGG